MINQRPNRLAVWLTAPVVRATIPGVCRLLAASLTERGCGRCPGCAS